MTENSALQEAIEAAKHELKERSLYMQEHHIQTLITHAETAQKRIAELEVILSGKTCSYSDLELELMQKVKDLEAKFPEVVTVERWFKIVREAERTVWEDHMRGIDSGGIRNDLGLALQKLFPRGLRIVKDGE